MRNWLNKKISALDEQLEREEISEHEHKAAVLELRQEWREIEADYRRDEAQDRGIRGW